MKYDYLENIKADILQYLKDEKDYIKGESFDDLYDDLFISDSITGNASGSYYCNTWKAEESLTHNMDILAEALEMFGCDNINIAEKGAEWCDVTIRCYLLSQAMEELREEIEEVLNNE